MTNEHVDKHPLRTLILLIGAGSMIFMLGLSILLAFLGYAGRVWYDPSVLDFYPLMAGLGALFGFERWWGYEYGETNPFHDR
ncbi:MAG: hypothetical protein KGI38_07115 [Thaumarchaeota archaeon]|nr:hypothetical protein [Nitrososphaerota archaeon]